jgi:hypothetical protein
LVHDGVDGDGRFAGLPVADDELPLAAAMVGGLLTSFILELLVYPVVYSLWKKKSLPHHA